MKNFFVLIFLPILLIGCQTFDPPEIQELTFEKTPYYEQDLSLPKPDSPPQPVYVKVLDNGLSSSTQIPGTNNNTQNKTFVVVDNPSDANYIMLAPKEYAKVGAIVRLAVTYKELTEQEKVLTNTYVDQINSLKSLVEIERQKVAAYRNLWVDSENAFRQERKSHRIDNVINKSMWLGTVAGAAILFVAL